MGAINKVVFGSDTLIDLTADTVAPETLAAGITAHDKSGAAIVGTAEFGSGGGGGGGSIPSAAKKDVNFYDYDGTLLYGYTVAEAAALTELPALPSHEGLICQGWNWTLDGIKAMGRAVNVGAMYITDDGKTRVYIRLEDGRTSPMLGCCPNGTVTVDWGDGTTPDVLTGTSTSTVQWTPTHEYAAPGDYVIELTVDGTMGFYNHNLTNTLSAILRHSSGQSSINKVYQNAIYRVEIGSGVTRIENNSFNPCYSLTSITIPEGVTSIGVSAFNECYGLSSITIPARVTSIASSIFLLCYNLSSLSIPDGVTSIGNNAFKFCYSLSNVAIPDSVTSIGTTAFADCLSLSSIKIPDSVTSIENNTFQNCKSLSSIIYSDGLTTIGERSFNTCYSLTSITIPDGVTSIGDYTFVNCYRLSSITIPVGINFIGNDMFKNCYSLSRFIIPESVTKIYNNAFANCYGVHYYDFSHHTAVPTLSNKNAFSGIAADCEIRVPAELVDEWKAATNWATYADKIVGV